MTSRKKPDAAARARARHLSSVELTAASSDLQEVSIVDLSVQGHGVGRDAEGRTAFLPLTAVGDRVKASITRNQKRFWHGSVVEVLEQSEDRSEPPCPLFGTCGGCDWQHLHYPSQLRWKAHILQQSVQRIGRVDWPEAPAIIGASEPLYTRTRARFRLNEEWALSFFERGSHAPVSIQRCLVLHPALERAIPALNEVLAQWAIPFQEVRLLTSTQEQLLLSLHLPKKSPLGRSIPKRFDRMWQEVSTQLEGLLGMECWQGRRLLREAGQPWIVEGQPKVRYRASGFAQASFALNQSLIEEMLSMLPEPYPRDVLELYAGSGNLSLPIASRGARVLALESVKVAVKDGRWAADQLTKESTGSVDFVPFHDERDTLQATWKRFKASDAPDKPSLVVVDPPRRGLSQEVRDAFCTWKPEWLLYVSCDPPTLARDIRSLVAAGYTLEKLRAVDLMPQTAHLESIALLHCRT